MRVLILYFHRELCRKEVKLLLKREGATEYVRSRFVAHREQEDRDHQASHEELAHRVEVLDTRHAEGFVFQRRRQDDLGNQVSDLQDVFDWGRTDEEEIEVPLSPMA